MRYARIPDQTVERLPIYLRALLAWTEFGRKHISSGDLASCVGVHSWQVRKDFSHFGEFGTPGVGYNVVGLIGQIRKILKLDICKKAVLVGVGNLGRAVLSYGGFEKYGLEIVAAFDTASDKVGQCVCGVRVTDWDDLPSLRHRKIRLAILAVPVGVAQGAVDALVGAGIQGILNFAACHLVVPKKVRVANVDIAMQLASLPYYISSG